MIRIVWEYRVRPGRREEFESHYRGDGTWAIFFARDPAYRGTVLARDPEALDRYLTIDSWDSLAAFEAFKGRFSEEYRSIDAMCEAFTEEERRLGVFETV